MLAQCERQDRRERYERTASNLVLRGICAMQLWLPSAICMESEDSITSRRLLCERANGQIRKRAKVHIGEYAYGRICEWAPPLSNV